MAVVAFHLFLLHGNSRYLNDAVFLNFTHRGNLGVDFFFVLSVWLIIGGFIFNMPMRDQGHL